MWLLLQVSPLGSWAWAQPAPEPEMIPIEVFEAAKTRAPPSDAAPIELELATGDQFRLADHQGHPVLLAFWASWCGPCRAELPALATWAHAHPEVAVVSVNVDRQRAAAKRFTDAVSFDLPVAFDPDAMQLGHYGVQSMPTSFLYDRKGTLAWQHTGYSADKGFTELEDALRSLK